MKGKISRRDFIGNVSAIGAAAAISPNLAMGKSRAGKVIKPPRLNKGDTIGLIAPASGVREQRTIREAKETWESLGFKVKTGRHIAGRYGYLAGKDNERVEDLHDMFADNEVKALVALRGGYGTIRILDMIDYDLIRKNPKIILGYSDITSLHIAIHQMAGLVTFHGPVAISSFTEYTQEYLFKALSAAQPAGLIAHPEPDNALHPTAHFATIHGGSCKGQLTGGNLSLIVASIGTPYEIDTKGKILFIEEVGEEPYAIDRMLTQLSQAGKLDQAAGIVLDRCSRCGVSDTKPAFQESLGVEEVFVDRLSHLNIPVVLGFSIGHVANKPTLPLGVRATLNADARSLTIDESAVV